MSVVSRNDVERFPLTDDYSTPPKSTRSKHCQAPDWQHALFTTRSWYVYQETDAHTHTYYTDQTNRVCATNHCLAFLVCPVYTVQLPSFLTQIYSAFLPQAPLVFFASSDLMTEECWTFSGPWACSTCLRWKDYNQAWSSWEQSCE